MGQFCRQMAGKEIGIGEISYTVLLERYLQSEKVVVVVLRLCVWGGIMGLNFSKKNLVVSILCALSGIGLDPVVVHATGTSVVSDHEDIIGNSYSINETPINSVYTVYSAMHNGAGTVTQNTITVQADLNWDTSSKIPPQLYGGYSNSGLASYNTVNVSATDVYDVCGGASKYYGSATYNKVIVGNDVKAGKWGNATYALVVGGVVINGSADSVAQYNEVTIKATDKNLKEDYYIDYVLGGQIRGKNQGDVLDNKATLERGHINLLIGGESGSGNAIRNHVFLEGGLVASRDKSLNGGGVYGGTASISASENTVTITGGKVIGNVLGGTDASEANDNEVIISGGEIIGSVWGGRGTTVANNNLVEIQGTPNLTRASLFGGEAPNTQGNTLNIKTSGIVVQQIGDFQKLNFHIDHAVDSDSLLKVIGDQSTDISGSDVNVYLADQAVPLESGQEIVLLESAQDLLTDDDFDGLIIYNKPEGLLDYGLSFNVTRKTLGIQVNTVEAKPETESFLTSNLSRMAFINQGSDLVVGQGLAAVRESIQNGQRLFVALQTGSNHYNIDSYIDMEGESLLMGGSWSVGAPDSQVTLGAFFESGWADYEVENELAPLSILKGKGETHYQGGGYWPIGINILLPIRGFMRKLPCD